MQRSPIYPPKAIYDLGDGFTLVEVDERLPSGFELYREGDPNPVPLNEWVVTRGNWTFRRPPRTTDQLEGSTVKEQPENARPEIAVWECTFRNGFTIPAEIMVRACQLVAPQYRWCVGTEEDRFLSQYSANLGVLTRIRKGLPSRTTPDEKLSLNQKGRFENCAERERALRELGLTDDQIELSVKLLSAQPETPPAHIWTTVQAVLG